MNYPSKRISRAKEIFSSPYAWCMTTYFAEGFPFSIIRTLSSLFFRDMKVSLESIGLTSLFGLPWVLKFLWSPHIDTFGTKRGWMLIMQSLLAIATAITALLVPLPFAIPAIATLFLLASFIAATHDVAIDGYYMEALDKEGQAKFVGYRIMAYRVAMITGTGVIATIGTTLNWGIAFMIAAGLLVVLVVYHYFFLPKCEVAKRPMAEGLRWFINLKVLASTLLLATFIIAIRYYLGSQHFSELKTIHPLLKEFNFASIIGILLLLSLVLLTLLRKKIKQSLFKNDPDSFYSRAFVAFIDRPHIAIMLAVIILLRTGEAMLTAMVSPFIVDLGIKAHYGWISGGVGLVASIVGAMMGGHIISRFSLRSVLWPILALQNLTNLVYMVLGLYLSDFIVQNTAASEPLFIGDLNLALVAFVHGFDQWAGGLGTAVLTTFIMRLCLQEYKAVHFAIGTGLMSISGLMIGAVSGFMVAEMGYGIFFGVSFLFSIPSMILILFLPKDLINQS
ncbi:MAG: MFS transporter [Oligoflexia bacterium]|nr:MFS transporter [Oligoflexia bacterium]MBF0364896.1 MFS transporter [Oligoflexia bacterium]